MATITYLDISGLEHFYYLLDQIHDQTKRDLQAGLANRYTKEETDNRIESRITEVNSSMGDLETKLNNIPMLKVWNRDEIDSDPEHAVQDCNKYMYDNYHKYNPSDEEHPAPYPDDTYTPLQNLDTLVLTLTYTSPSGETVEGDRVRYAYSEYSKTWYDTGRQNIDISIATNTAPGILKLYQDISGDDDAEGTVAQPFLKNAFNQITMGFDQIDQNFVKSPVGVIQGQLKAITEQEINDIVNPPQA